MDPTYVAPVANNPELVIRQVIPSITTFSVPFARGGLIPVGGRSTAVKLASGDVFLIASHPLCTETLATLRSIGTPKYLVAPDLEHNIYVSQYAQAFPEAKVYAPDSLVKGKWANDPVMKGRTHFVYARDGNCDLSTLTKGEIESVDFGKAFVNEDIAFLHTTSKTLIVADLLFNLPCKEQYSKSSSSGSIPFLSSMFSVGGSLQKSALWNVLCKDRASMAASAKRVSAMDFDRIIPCHGDVIETGGKVAWNSTYARFLTGKL